MSYYHFEKRWLCVRLRTKWFVFEVGPAGGPLNVKPGIWSNSLAFIAVQTIKMAIFQMTVAPQQLNSD